MPELPEIKMYAKNLDALIGGKTIEDVRSYTGGDFSAVAGRTVSRVVSYGKEIFIELRGGGNLYVHLMLTGRFSFVGREEYALVKDKIFALKTEGKYLIVSDVNRYAKVERNRARSLVPEAGGADFTLEYFLKLLDTRAKLKSVLVDNTRIVGIGNAYADEILYRAGVSPFSVCDKLPLEAAKRVFAAVGEVFGEAIDYLGKAHPDMIEGEDRSFFKVHVAGRTSTERGEKITVAALGGRKTYCADSQTLYA